MKSYKLTGMDSPDIIKYFSNTTLYNQWLDNLGQPLSKTIINIPARSSSKRLKNKNIKKLNGIPLLAYSVIVAKNIPAVDRVFVNTDSPEYASVAKEFGAEVPFLRPKEFADDGSSIAKANHFLTRYLMEESYPLCSIINFYPTSPFRNLTVMNQLTDYLSTHTTVITCIKVDYSPDKICNVDGYRVVKKDHLEKYNEDRTIYKTTGSFLGINRGIDSQECNKLYFHNNIIETIDIDNDVDFNLAEEIIKNNIYDFGVVI